VTVPDDVVVLLAGVPEIGAREQAFPFVTVDPDGFPHAALLSRMELEVGPDRADVRAAVRSGRTRENLEQRARATLIAVEGRTAHYVKLRLVRSMAVHDLLACVFEMAEHKADSMGIALTPITYPVTADIARAERWDTTVEALGLLR
jgi:tetraacyldisaccharide-1-P 4'-kinase